MAPGRAVRARHPRRATPLGVGGEPGPREVRVDPTAGATSSFPCHCSPRHTPDTPRVSRRQTNSRRSGCLARRPRATIVATPFGRPPRQPQPDPSSSSTVSIARTWWKLVCLGRSGITQTRQLIGGATASRRGSSGIQGHASTRASSMTTEVRSAACDLFFMTGSVANVGGLWDPLNVTGNLGSNSARPRSTTLGRPASRRARSTSAVRARSGC